MLHITANDVPQRIGHDVNSTGCSPTLLIQSWGAIVSWGPCSSFKAKQPFSRNVISVCNSLNLCLDCMGVFRGVFNRLMQPVLGAMAELTRLSTVTAVCVCLWLVHEEASNQEAGSTSTPCSISPLHNLFTRTQHIPSFQKCTEALVHQANAAACCSMRAIHRSPSPCQCCFFLVKDWNHAHNQPASRLRTHIVLKANERHCKSCVQTRSLDKTSKNSINMYKYTHIQTDTYTYAHSYSAFFSLSTSNTCTYEHIHACTGTYILTS
jgi:hypothetical protein